MALAGTLRCVVAAVAAWAALLGALGTTAAVGRGGRWVVRVVAVLAPRCVARALLGSAVLGTVALPPVTLAAAAPRSAIDAAHPHPEAPRLVLHRPGDAAPVPVLRHLEPEPAAADGPTGEGPHGLADTADPTPEPTSPGPAHPSVPSSAPQAPDVHPAAPTTWTIRPGEHLWAVAEAVVASTGTADDLAAVAAYHQRLVAANRPHLPIPDDPDLVFPGTELICPPP